MPDVFDLEIKTNSKKRFRRLFDTRIQMYFYWEGLNFKMYTFIVKRLFLNTLI